MKLMKLPRVWIATLSLLALACGSLHAEPTPGGPGSPKGPGHPEERRARMMERLKQELGLTPEQIEKIQQAGEAERAQMSKVREDASLTREQKVEAMRASRARMDAAIRAVLTPEQQVKFDQMVQQRKAKAGEAAQKKKKPASSS